MLLAKSMTATAHCIHQMECRMEESEFRAWATHQAAARLAQNSAREQQHALSIRGPCRWVWPFAQPQKQLPERPSATRAVCFAFHVSLRAASTNAAATQLEGVTRAA